MVKPFAHPFATRIGSLVLVLLCAGRLSATPGEIDCTFGDGGVAVVDFGGSELLSVLTLQEGGEIIAVGTNATSIQLTRLLADGSLATDFGNGGLSTVDLAVGFIADVAIDSEDRIVVVGGRSEAGDAQAFVARFTMDGDLDTSFDTDGWTSFGFAGPGAVDSATAVAVDDTDRVLVSGSTDANGLTFGQRDIALARFTEAGALDPSFDTDGLVVTNSGGTRDDDARGMRLVDGSIVVIGATNAIGEPRDTIVARYDASDGSLDPSFDGDGIRMLDLNGGGDDFGQNLAVDASGRVVGLSFGPSGNPTVFRLAASGILDPSFGTGGIVVTEFSPGVQDVPEHVEVQADGKILVSGWVTFDFALLRLTSSGVLDPTFSGDGRLTTDLGGQDRGTGFGIQQDGRLIVGGSTTSGSNPFNFAAVRYLGDGHLDGRTTTTIDLDTPDPSAIGQAVTVHYTVSTTAGTPTGNVIVGDGTAQCTGTVAAGRCILSLPTLGASSLQASYQGDGTFCPSTDSEPHTVVEGSTTTAIAADSPDPSVVGQPITVSFTVSSADGVPNGSVTVGDGQGADCTGTLIGGSGSCALTPNTAASVNLLATYLGDGAFAKSSDAVLHEVAPAETAVTIVSDSPDPSLPGQAVTVTVAVSALAPASGTPTGVVTIDDSDGESCVLTLAAGIGACSLVSSAAGTRDWTAAYTGDGNYLASSAAASHQVLDVEPPVVSLVDASPDTGNGMLAPCESTPVRVEALELVFSEPLRTGGDADAADNPNNYLLLAAGDDLSLSTVACGPPAGDDLALALASVIYLPDTPQASQSTVSLTLGRRLEDGAYRLVACATIADVAGNPLDGDADGTGGDDFALDFRVATSNLLTNSHFDCDLEDWWAMPAGTSQITHSEVDADGAEHSGTGLLGNTGGLVLSLGQCIAPASDLTGNYQLSARLRVDALPGIDAGIVRACDFFDNATCEGTPISMESASDLLPDTASGFVERAHTFDVPPGTLSVFCDITSGSADSSGWDLYVDQLILQITPIFRDGFESGDLSAWTELVP